MPRRPLLEHLTLDHVVSDLSRTVRRSAAPTPDRLEGAAADTAWRLAAEARRLVPSAAGRATALAFHPSLHLPGPPLRGNLDRYVAWHLRRELARPLPLGDAVDTVVEQVARQVGGWGSGTRLYRWYLRRGIRDQVDRTVEELTSWAADRRTVRVGFLADPVMPSSIRRFRLLCRLLCDPVHLGVNVSVYDVPAPWLTAAYTFDDEPAPASGVVLADNTAELTSDLEPAGVPDTPQLPDDVYATFDVLLSGLPAGPAGLWDAACAMARQPC